MQIISLTLRHHDFFCPATGQHITGPDHYTPSPATAGRWVFEFEEEPNIYSPELEAAWKEYLDEIASDDPLMIDEFLDRVELPNHICFRLFTVTMGCGPIPQTAWYVINMNDAAPPSN